MPGIISGIDCPGRYMIGDKFIDVQTRLELQAPPAALLVRTGYGRDTEIKESARLGRAVVADDLSAAVTWILQLPPATH